MKDQFDKSRCPSLSPDSNGIVHPPIGVAQITEIDLVKFREAIEKGIIKTES